jgi:hypothetical protein
MRARDVLMLFTAGLCGFLGSLISGRLQPARAESPETVRASRVELVGASGKPRAILSLNSRGSEPTLSFFTEDGKEVASVGLSSDLPMIRFRGTDGKLRAAFQLTARQRPVIGLGDETWEGRVILGAIEGDAPSLGSGDTDWGLSFTGAPPDRAQAVIGLMHSLSGRSFSGTLAVQDSKGKVFRAP